jgi:hypothetical protein
MIPDISSIISCKGTQSHSYREAIYKHLSTGEEKRKIFQRTKEIQGLMYLGPWPWHEFGP